MQEAMKYKQEIHYTDGIDLRSFQPRNTQDDGESSIDNTSQQTDTNTESQNSPDTPRTWSLTVFRWSDRTRRPPRWMYDYVPT